MLGQDFIVDGRRILVHGFFRVVLPLLMMTSSNGKHFSVFCIEGRPDNTGIEMTKELVAVGVPVKFIIDSAVAYTLEKVDLVLFGADGVVESGGIINMMGTYQTALVAHSMNKPIYVVAESYKLACLYPLDQTNMSPAMYSINFGDFVPTSVETDSSARDYTPPQYRTLLFTDLGVLTPFVVSDELIKLYL
ncbi:hypothetical protein SUGI_1168590 [Cryptomeria japonica]|nr:hypothetical protein SUGI_1168590 [Cryptomeria japonica]